MEKCVSLDAVKGLLTEFSMDNPEILKRINELPYVNGSPRQLVEYRKSNISDEGIKLFYKDDTLKRMVSDLPEIITDDHVAGMRELIDSYLTDTQKSMLEMKYDGFADDATIAAALGISMNSHCIEERYRVIVKNLVYGRKNAFCPTNDRINAGIICYGKKGSAIVLEEKMRKRKLEEDEDKRLHPTKIEYLNLPNAVFRTLRRNNIDDLAQIKSLSQLKSLSGVGANKVAVITETMKGMGLKLNEY